MHFRVHPSLRLVCSDRPEGRVLSCLDSSSTQAVSALCTLPFGLAMSPRVFTKVVEGALVPMREQGIRILNYLDDWLILAQSQELGSLPPVGLSGQLGKEQTLPSAEDLFSQYGVGFSQTVCTPHRGTCSVSVLNCLNTFRGRTAVPLKLFQRLLGHMAVAVTPLGLLHMRPLQHWLHAARTEWQSLWNAAKPSARSQTPCFFGQECP